MDLKYSKGGQKNAIETMMSCTEAQPWNGLYLLWSLLYGTFFKFDKYVLCGITGIADLACE